MSRCFWTVPSGSGRGRSCHDTIKALYDHLDRYEVETVIDVDLANFFGTIDHQRLLELLAEKRCSGLADNCLCFRPPPADDRPLKDSNG